MHCTMTVETKCHYITSSVWTSISQCYYMMDFKVRSVPVSEGWSNPHTKLAFPIRIILYPSYDGGIALN